MKDEKFMLHVPGSNKKWPVIIRIYREGTNKIGFHRERRKISVGWKKFAKENGLKIGDVCVFDLVKAARKFNVIIYRSDDD